MRNKKLKEMSLTELNEQLENNQDSIMNLRFQKSLGQLEHPLEIKNVRREIATIKTILREFELGIRGGKINNE